MPANKPVGSFSTSTNSSTYPWASDIVASYEFSNEPSNLGVSYTPEVGSVSGTLVTGTIEQVSEPDPHVSVGTLVSGDAIEYGNTAIATGGTNAITIEMFFAPGSGSGASPFLGELGLANSSFLRVFRLVWSGSSLSVEWNDGGGSQALTYSSGVFTHVIVALDWDAGTVKVWQDDIELVDTSLGSLTADTGGQFFQNPSADQEWSFFRYYGVGLTDSQIGDQFDEPWGPVGATLTTGTTTDATSGAFQSTGETSNITALVGVSADAVTVAGDTGGDTIDVGALAAGESSVSVDDGPVDVSGAVEGGATDVASGDLDATVGVTSDAAVDIPSSDSAIAVEMLSTGGVIDIAGAGNAGIDSGDLSTDALNLTVATGGTGIDSGDVEGAVALDEGLAEPEILVTGSVSLSVAAGEIAAEVVVIGEASAVDIAEGDGQVQGASSVTAEASALDISGSSVVSISTAAVAGTLDVLAASILSIDTPASAGAVDVSSAAASALDGFVRTALGSIGIAAEASSVSVDTLGTASVQITGSADELTIAQLATAALSMPQGTAIRNVPNAGPPLIGKVSLITSIAGALTLVENPATSSRLPDSIDGTGTL